MRALITGTLLLFCAAAAPAATEVKLLLDPASWSRAVQAYGLPADAKRRDIYFFDTRALDLYSQGLVLRARAGKKKADVTVKYRPPAGEPPPAVAARPGYKCEFDAGAQGAVYACSLTEDTGPEEVLAAAGGQSGPRALFSSAQRLWTPGVPWEELQTLGPVRSSAWEVPHADFGELDFERWDLPGGPSYFEVSLRDAGDGKAALEALRGELLRLGIRPAPEQSSKTRAALRHFSGR